MRVVARDPQPVQRSGFDGAYGPAVERVWHSEVDRLAEHQRAKRAQKRFRKAPAAPPAVIPRHVQQCGTAGLYLWKADGTGATVRAVYRCGSFRCRICAPHEAHVLFERLREAFEGRDGLLFWVLTFAQRSKALDVNEAYRDIKRCSNRLLKRLRRFARHMGWEPFKNEYAQTVEAHQSGWPHVNMLMAHPELRDWILDWQQHRDKQALCGACRACEYCRETLLLPPLLRDMAEASGFGWQSTIDVPRSAEAVLGYVTKIAAKHDAVVGEVAKLTQLPLMAPQRFRRIRAGKGFLPARHTGDGTWTGTIAMRRRDDDGSQRVLIPRTAMSNVSPDVLARCEQARELELQLADSEDAHRSRTGKRRHWPLTMTYDAKTASFVSEHGPVPCVDLAYLSRMQV
jgi:hypothetical protein